jgi:hypothetical protein
MYSEPLRIPSELLTPTADPVEPAHLITQLGQHMAHLRPFPAKHYTSSAILLHRDLHNSKHNFLHQKEPLFIGPYQFLLWREIVSSCPVNQPRIQQHQCPFGETKLNGSIEEADIRNARSQGKSQMKQ